MKKNVIPWLLIVALLLCSVLLGGCTPPPAKPSDAHRTISIAEPSDVPNTVVDTLAPVIWNDTLIYILNNTLYMKTGTETKKWNDGTYKGMLLADPYLYLITFEFGVMRINLNIMKKEYSPLHVDIPDTIDESDEVLHGNPTLYYTNEKLYAVYTFYVIDRHYTHYSILEISDDFEDYTLLQTTDDRYIEWICGEYLYYSEKASNNADNRFRNIYTSRLDGTGEATLFLDGKKEEKGIRYFDENTFIYNDSEGRYWLSDIKTEESKKMLFQNTEKEGQRFHYKDGYLLLTYYTTDEEGYYIYLNDVYYYDFAASKPTYLYTVNNPLLTSDTLIVGEDCYAISKDGEYDIIDGKEHYISELIKVHIPTQEIEVIHTEKISIDSFS